MKKIIKGGEVTTNPNNPNNPSNGIKPNNANKKL
jgi:hypothetical protein